MRVCLLINLLLLAGLTSAQSSYENVLIEAQKGFGYPPCEPSICVSPADPSHVVAGAILDRLYTSADSGKTWTADALRSKYGVFGDPTLIASPEGHFYYLHLSDPSGRGWADPGLLDRIVCQYSSDNGKTWSEGAGMGKDGNKDQDKQWATVSPDGKHVYATWTQFDRYNSKEAGDSTLILFSCGNAKGAKWKEPVRLSQFAGNCLDGDMTVEGAVPASGTNGEIYVTWALGDTLWFDRSLDGGKTWMDQDRVAGEIIGGWDQHIPGINRCNGMPVTMVDHSDSPNRGRIYVLFADQRAGEDDTDVFCIHSHDRGESWSEAIRVNDDAPGKHQFFPWLAVDNSTGHLYAVFYDRRDHDDQATDVYLATSTDGGVTWINERISESPFTPVEGVFFGDYNNISAVNGVVRPIWTRYEKGRLSIWTALINK